MDLQMKSNGFAEQAKQYAGELNGLEPVQNLFNVLYNISNILLRYLCAILIRVILAEINLRKFAQF
jgi:hypothetical protein